MAKQQITKSIYDFIYLDLDRIHSYYAQLMDGVPNQKTSTSREHKNYVYKATAGPRSILQASGEKGSGKEESFEQSMDMLHVLPRDMINLLDEHELIAKKLAASNLGKLVMIQGLINFADFETLGKNSDNVLSLLSDKSDREMSEIKTVMKVIDAYPIGVQAMMQVKSNVTNHAWMALDKKYLTSAHLISALKHKSLSSEEFVVLGILDAIPDKFIEKDSNNDLDKFRSNLLHKRPFFEAIFAMNGTYQEIIGRPTDSYGITPISIFRVMKAKVEN